MSDRMKEIEERLEKASPGPWFTAPTPNDEEDWPTCVLIAATAPGPRNRVYAAPKGGTFPLNDRDFIAHAPDDIRYLLAELKTAREEAEAAYHQGYRHGMKDKETPPPGPPAAPDIKFQRG